jgi:hypothetical protein
MKISLKKENKHEKSNYGRHPLRDESAYIVGRWWVGDRVFPTK